MCDMVCRLGFGEKTTNVAAFDVPVPLLSTVTVALPGDAIRLAGMVAVSCVALP